MVRFCHTHRASKALKTGSTAKRNSVSSHCGLSAVSGSVQG